MITLYIRYILLIFMSVKAKTMKERNLRLIVVSTSNYFELKKRGLAGDSFNDVITKLLAREGEGEEE